MINLLNEKLEAVLKLKDYTKDIARLSPKIEDEKINSLIDGRKKYFEIINEINERIISKSKEENFKETEEIKILNERIKAEIKQIMLLDNEIRKNINREMKEIKDKLNQPNTTNTQGLNIKA